MIIQDKDAIARLKSPMNLFNRLSSLSEKKTNAMSLFGIGKKNSTEQPKIEQPKKEDIEHTEVVVTFNPFQKVPPKDPPLPNILPEQTKLDDIIDNADSHVKLGLAHDKALDLLVNSVSHLAAKLDDVKADKLPSVIAAASKTVESIRRERVEAAKNNKDREVHYHFYTPAQKSISDYKVIDVNGDPSVSSP